MSHLQFRILVIATLAGVGWGTACDSDTGGRHSEPTSSKAEYKPAGEDSESGGPAEKDDGESVGCRRVRTEGYADGSTEGAPDETVRYRYDAEGRRSEALVYAGRPTGSPTERRSFSYDAAGRLVRTSVHRGQNEAPERVETYSYDAHGRRIREARDENADGEPEFVLRFRYDEQGRRSRRLWDRDGDGDVETVEQFIHAEHESKRDDRNIGAVHGEEGKEWDVKDDAQVVTILRHDADGRIVESETVFPPVGYGSPRSKAYIYDEAGRLVRERSMKGPPDRPVEVETRVHTYECPE